MRDYASMSKAEAVRLIMEERRVDELKAEFILSIILGERTGDIEIVRSNG